MGSNFSTNSTDVYFYTDGPCYDTGDTDIQYVLCIMFFSFSVLMICGNLLVITSIIYFKQLHTPTNYLILSLALTDLIVGMLVLPFGVIPIDRRICGIMYGIEFYVCSASVLILCFISVDRYYAVCQPLMYRTKMNVRVTVIMILVSWTLPAIGYTHAYLQEFFCFFLPVVIMSGIYIKILIVAQRQARSIQNTTSQRTKSESKMERKATKTLAIVMGVFLISWCPFFMYMFLCHFTLMNVTYSYFSLRCLGWSNSMLNPLIYGFFYSWFRSAFRMIISGTIFQGDFTHSKLS